MKTKRSNVNTRELIAVALLAYFVLRKMDILFNIYATTANECLFQPGNNMAGICNLERCGSSLCGQNELDVEGNCRVETWTTPFRMRVAFGPGTNMAGTLEDNAGVCLTYQQLACVA